MNAKITIIQAMIFIAYIAFLLIKFKRIWPSISDSWYELKGLQKSLFTLFCWSIGFLMFFQTDGSTGFFFLSGAGLCFTGAAAMFREKMTKTVHFAGAIASVLGAFMALYFERGSIYPVIVFGLSVIFIHRIKNHIWWIEISAFACILYGLLIAC